MMTRAGFVRSTFVLLGLAVTLALVPARVQAQSFELLDDDVVVLLGDSNTAPGTYQRYLERYTAIRFPERDIRYINMGIGGDTAVGGLARLQRDVFDRGATALIVTYGINDICWGLCDDDAHRQAYYQAIIDIILACANHGVRVYVTTYPYRGAASQPLQDMTTTGTAIATYLGQKGIDVYTTMKNIDTGAAQTQQCLTDAASCPTAFVQVCQRSCNKWAPNDGVHLSDVAQRAWAYALAKGLGAPTSVSAATLNAPTASVTTVSNTTITNVVWNAGASRLTFNRLDAAQPLTFGSNTTTYFNNLEVPFHTLSGTSLKVTNLPAGTYRITVAGQSLGTVTNAQLAAGIDIASRGDGQWAYGGPWMFANDILAGLITARSSANWLYLAAKPGSAIETLLDGADALAGIVEDWARTPTSNAVVIEPAV